MKNIILILILVFSFNVMAKDGSSGCGPGWFILKDNSLVSSALRATTNGIFFPTTTIGMTVGTSNCSKHKIVKNEKKSLHFVTHNLYEIKAEATKGSGEYLKALNETIGCNSQSAGLLSQQLKANYQEVFTSEKADSVLTNIYKVIFRDKQLTKSCTLS